MVGLDYKLRELHDKEDRLLVSFRLRTSLCLRFFVQSPGLAQKKTGNNVFSFCTLLVQRKLFSSQMRSNQNKGHQSRYPVKVPFLTQKNLYQVELL
jgi:hypothetical protein